VLALTSVLEDAAVVGAMRACDRVHAQERRGRGITQRCSRCLRGASAHKLTLVAAPPGFGKSTLLAEWASTQPAAGVAWLSLDENDNDPARLFTYVVAALRRAEPGLGERALAALRSPGAGLMDLVLPLFLNDLAGLNRDLVLVMDDYHLISNSEVHEAVAYLVERSPPAVRVILSTREDPALPLGRIRAGGELAGLRAVPTRRAWS